MGLSRVWKSTSRRNWERIALMVEDALPSSPRIVARRAPGLDAFAARPAIGLMASAN